LHDGDLALHEEVMSFFKLSLAKFLKPPSAKCPLKIITLNNFSGYILKDFARPLGSGNVIVCNSVG